MARSALGAALQMAWQLLTGRTATQRALREIERQMDPGVAERARAAAGIRPAEERRLESPPTEPEPDRPGENGAMLPARSSNVHSYGYLRNRRVLQIRFLGVGQGGVRGGPGALYHYFHVPPEAWERLKAAASKGSWVWDELRIRGTIHGHKYDYSLAGVEEGDDVPRKATAEGLNPREISQDGRIFRSRKGGTGRFG